MYNTKRARQKKRRNDSTDYVNDANVNDTNINKNHRDRFRSKRKLDVKVYFLHHLFRFQQKKKN